ncbi:MAG: IPExxxVDY family protein [Chitinophagaceae bacterium]|nr:IPExxxVDY family protein [Chitinophagaceae bacterium]MCW5904846.1 IPExxxVDY family protein [Chitinophagaceae bacterium]
MKLKLDIDALNDDFFENAKLLGISTTVKNYKLCWQLNNLLGFNFRLNNELEIRLLKRKNKKEREYFFSIYESRETANTLVHYLYHNQYEGEYLLPEFRNIDFLWLMKGDIVENEKVDDIKNAIKNIYDVQLVTELTNEKIKNKGNMVF